MKQLKVVRDFFVKGCYFERLNTGIYSSCILQLDLSVSQYDIEYLIIKRYQAGEVNSIKYADSLRMYPDDKNFIAKAGSIFICTDCLGYGKSVHSVTYYVAVTVVLKSGLSYEGVCYQSDVICAKTPDTEMIYDIYKEV